MNTLDKAVQRVSLLNMTSRSLGKKTITVSVEDMALVLEAAERTTNETIVYVLEEIMQAVCNEYGIKKSTMRGGCRVGRLPEARQMVYHFGREYAHATYPAIGKAINKDHSTVQNGCRRVTGRLDAGDRPTKDLIYRISRRLNS